MEAILASILIFVLFIAVTLLVLIKVSTISALFVLFFIPVIMVLIFPNVTLNFLSHELMLLLSDQVQLTNFHILLFIWAAMISVITYTEFITWYLKRQVAGSKQKGSDNQGSESSSDRLSFNLNMDGVTDRIKNTYEKYVK